MIGAGLAEIVIPHVMEKRILHGGKSLSDATSLNVRDVSIKTIRVIMNVIIAKII